jgi:uncharacterized membrane protein YeaQ/YmgE (transglycosylase-associated protein family)
MSFSMFVSWVFVGALVGVLAGLVMKRGGYGLKKDVTLGLVGSIGAGWIIRGFGVFPSAGMFAMAVIVAIGAALAIVIQRTLVATERAGDEKGVMWRWGFGAVLVAATAATLAYVPSPYREETLNFAVRVGATK